MYSAEEKKFQRTHHYVLPPSPLTSLSSKGQKCLPLTTSKAVKLTHSYFSVHE